MRDRTDRNGRGTMRILVAIDGSEHGDSVVDAISRRRLTVNSEVRVISVVAPYLPATYLPYGGGSVDMSRYEQIESNARTQAQAVVDKATTRLRAIDESRQLRVTTKVLVGSPKALILEEAEAFGADLIIVGSHGHGMVERFLLGSVSQAVALHASCSVEIVRSPKLANDEAVAAIY